MKKNVNYLILLLTIIFMVGCTNVEDVATTDNETAPKVAATENSDIKSEKEDAVAEVVEEPDGEEPEVEETSTGEKEEEFPGYDILKVDGGDLSGYRQPNVVVDIGFGGREY